MTETSTATPFSYTNAHLSSNVSRNGSLNGNEDEYAQVRQFLHTMSIIVFCLAFIFGVLGNGLVIWVIGFKMKLNATTFWFLNLAVADFLFTAFLPLSVAYTAMHFHWPFGKFMCKFHNTINVLNMFASVYILVIISVDRCVCVVWPVWAQNHRSVRKASCVSVGVWVLAVVLSTPYFFLKDTMALNPQNIIYCYNNYAFSDGFVTPSVLQLRHRAMTISRITFGFVVPFTVIVSSYAVIIYRLRNRAFANQSGRTFKIIIAIIITFFLCWVPYHTLTLTEMVKMHMAKPPKSLHHVLIIGAPIATSLAYFNSCMNPLLYVFIGHDFKNKVCKSVLKILENAFQEEGSRSQTYTKTVTTSQSKDKSVSDTMI
ncbi:chemokine-like receptor 1 isoform X2 [Sphaeramia orbicularis]|uniref:Chemokine-like receptor 1 n=1 Tax=Sphaeramia orbicularis TaxID=375764 RepID=A0A673AV38_9TELE|nr:chemokine-like receptor 1 isoform X2 [Sphaeramia orbicularis]